MAEMDNETVTLDPERRFGYTGSYKPTVSGTHYFWVRVTYDQGSWIEENVTTSYDRSQRFLVVEPSKTEPVKKTAGFEIFFAIAAIIMIAIMTKRYRS